MPEGRGLFEVAREKIRSRHMAFRTEQAYLQWMRRYVKFHGRRHPREVGPAEVEAFLTHLAVERKVGASTQNQALHALLFLYRQVLDIELPWLENITRASRPKRLPVVLSAAEVRSLLAHLGGTSWLIANLLYGSGLRLMEAHRLRIKDLLIERGELIVRDAKGGKDRVTVLPAAIIAPLREHLAKLRLRFERQRELREPGVSLPTAFAVNIRARQLNGAGSGSSRRTLFARMRIPASRPASINTRELCSGRSRSPHVGRGSCSRRAVIPFVIALRRICSRPAMTSAPCRNY
jgi:integrase